MEGALCGATNKTNMGAVTLIKSNTQWPVHNKLHPVNYKSTSGKRHSHKLKRPHSKGLRVVCVRACVCTAGTYTCRFVFLPFFIFPATEECVMNKTNGEEWRCVHCCMMVALLCCVVFDVLESTKTPLQQKKKKKIKVPLVHLNLKNNIIKLSIREIN